MVSKESVNPTNYTLEQAEDHIGNLIGQVDVMGEILNISDSQVPDTPPGLGNGSAIYSLSGVPQAITDVGLAGTIPVTIGDSTNFAVTQATDTQASQSFSVPGNDPNAGTTYRLTAWGSMTQGSTAQITTWSLYFGGSSRITLQVGAGQFNASAGIRWKVQLTALCATAGAGGTWMFAIDVTESLTAGTLLAGQGLNGTIAGCNGTGANVAVDTTVANTMLLEAAWGSTTGAPTLTCRGTLFERLGA